jgi:ADP-L-glycero-D-manno-heptose 6-epimerase
LPPAQRQRIVQQEKAIMIVVTGASGFIASRLVQALNRRGETDVIAVDEYPQLRNLSQPIRRARNLRYGEQMTVAGFLDKQDLAPWLRRNIDKVSAVFHLGACSDTTATDREWIMANNFAYTRTLWRLCTETPCPFIYASSAATYGDGSLGYDDEIDPKCYQPLNLYGESKHRFDLWALKQQETPPRWAGLKYFNVYGPHEEHKGRMASVVYHGFHQICREGRIRLFQSHREEVPDGSQSRDFVYVDDVVNATLHFLNTPVTATSANGLYNVGVGEARSFADLAKAIFRAIGREPQIDYIPMPLDLRNRYQYFTKATIAKLRQAGFNSPMKSIEDGVWEYVHSHLSKQHRAA